MQLTQHVIKSKQHSNILDFGQKMGVFGYPGTPIRTEL